MALVNPHPALKVAVPMNPMVDGWIGDDWFHNGAFRQQGMSFFYDQGATRRNDLKWWTSHFDEYDMFMEAGTAGELGRRRGLEQVGIWRKVLEHPTYDAFWRDQAMDRVLAAQPLEVPVMLVHGLWDQEDIYGAPAVYRAIEPKDTSNDKVFLVMGPWNHGQQIHEGSSLGALRFGSGPVPGAAPEGRRPQGRHRAGLGVRDGHQRVAAPRGVAVGLRERLPGHAETALPAAGPRARLRAPRCGRQGLRGIRLRPRPAGAVPRAPHPAGRVRPPPDLAPVAG
jgi:hypothetical protein